MQRKFHRLHQMPEGQITWVLKTVAGLDWGQWAPRTSLSARTVSMRARLRAVHPVCETLQPLLPLPCEESSWESKELEEVDCGSDLGLNTHVPCPFVSAVSPLHQPCVHSDLSRSAIYLLYGLQPWPGSCSPISRSDHHEPLHIASSASLPALPSCLSPSPLPPGFHSPSSAKLSMLPLSSWYACFAFSFFFFFNPNFNQGSWIANVLNFCQWVSSSSRNGLSSLSLHLTFLKVEVNDNNGCCTGLLKNRRHTKAL